MENELTFKIIQSWMRKNDTINSTQDILNWIEKLKSTIYVKIQKIKLGEMNEWEYNYIEKGIVRKDLSFFQIKGFHEEIVCGEEKRIREQPIIIQNEIGYLGIICKEIDGILYFLMQAKIEPGNINVIQISPTIQATKSNFMQSHGGNAPMFLDYFVNNEHYDIIVDQVQSEQASRFLKKRNRNIIIKVDEEINDIPSNYKWMTLGQIKELMKIDNLVNMDTRTVISCIPLSLRNYTNNTLDELKKMFNNKAFFNSIFHGSSGMDINRIYHYINDIKMMSQKRTGIVDLFGMKDWKYVNGELKKESENFKVIFCDIEIEGREVRRWQQPLFEAVEEEIFGLIYCVYNNKMLFLTKVVSEIGCFDMVELGPSIQGVFLKAERNNVESLFFDNLEKGKGIVFSGVFSEEGGRFYHEQNRNIIMQVSKEEIGELPNGFFWVDFQTLNTLVQFNNCLNIQLRNLLSILDL